MLTIFSDESIAVQRTGSPLANDLITAFQEVIDKRESIKTVKDRVAQIPKFVKDVTVMKIMTAIKKHTGIECTNIRLSKSIDMGFACLMNFGDKWGLTANDVIARYSGLDPDPMLKMYMREMDIQPRSAEEMRVVAESLNRETGKFTVNKLADKTPCTMVMYFDPYGAFLVKECSHIKLEYFTAEEITGIVLHEIGHMISTLAHSADLCFRMQVYNRSLEYFVKNAPLAEKASYMKSQLNLLDPKIKSKSDQAIDQCTAQDGAHDHGSVAGSIFGWFADMLIMAVQTLALIPIVSIIVEEGYAVTKEMFPELYTGSFRTRKTSDHFFMSKQAKLCEQFADEYVSKHGMSHGQVSALNKLWDWAEFSLSFGSYAGSTTSTLAYYINKIPFVFMSLMYGDLTDGGGIYDGKTERAYHLLEETAKSFKNTLSPEMADFFIEDYIKTKNALKNRSLYDKIRDCAEWSRKAIGYLLSALPAMLISGRITTEYEKLYRSGEKLMSNQLFYQATVLEKMLR